MHLIRRACALTPLICVWLVCSHFTSYLFFLSLLFATSEKKEQQDSSIFVDHIEFLMSTKHRKTQGKCCAVMKNHFVLLPVFWTRGQRTPRTSRCYSNFQNVQQTNKHLDMMLRIVLIKYICMKLEWHPSTRQSPPPSSEEGIYSSSVRYASSPQATRMLLIFNAASLCFFYEGSARAGRLFGFRKEKAPQLPKMIGGWETMAHPVWFSLLLEPRPPRCNPLFLLFVRSWLPPPIGCVSFGPGTLRQPDQYGRASCQRDGEERGEWEKCFNCCKNLDCLGKLVWEMCG